MRALNDQAGIRLERDGKPALRILLWTELETACLPGQNLRQTEIVLNHLLVKCELYLMQEPRRAGELWSSLAK